MTDGPPGVSALAAWPARDAGEPPGHLGTPGQSTMNMAVVACGPWQLPVSMRRPQGRRDRDHTVLAAKTRSGPGDGPAR
jgi:hypothetical protein